MYHLGIVDEILGTDGPGVEVFMQIVHTMPVDEAVAAGDILFNRILSSRIRSEADNRFLTFWKDFKGTLAKQEARAKALARIQATPEGTVVPGPIVQESSSFKLSTPMIVGGASAALLVVALVLRGRKKKGK